MIFLCYDITDPDSWANIPNWLEEIKKYSLEKTKITICGTKLDLDSKRKITEQEALDFAKSHNFDYIELSSKTNRNVNELFELASGKLLSSFITSLENINHKRKNKPLHPNIVPNLKADSKNNSYKKCC